MLEDEKLEDEMDEDESNLPNLAKPFIAKAEWLISQQCRDCLFRYKNDFIIRGKKIPCVDGWQNGSCMIFPYPKMKPMPVLENREKCEYYEKDENAPARE